MSGYTPGQNIQVALNLTNNSDESVSAVILRVHRVRVRHKNVIEKNRKENVHRFVQIASNYLCVKFESNSDANNKLKVFTEFSFELFCLCIITGRKVPNSCRQRIQKIGFSRNW